jgi:hypothetical protein
MSVPVKTIGSEAEADRATCAARRRALGSAWMLVLAACASNARAPGETMPVAVVRTAPGPGWYAHVDGGFGMPEGLIGSGFGLSPTRWFSLELGGGLSNSGLQAASMLGVHIRVSDSSELGLFGGVSIGRNTDVETPFLDAEGIRFEKIWPWVLWSNLEFTARRILNRRAAVRFHVGLARPLAHARPHCDASSDLPGTAGEAWILTPRTWAHNVSAGLVLVLGSASRRSWERFAALTLCRNDPGLLSRSRPPTTH